MKTMFAAAGLPIVPHLTVLRPAWQHDARSITARVAGELRYPVFVKPANLGSSVGISKAKSDAEFVAAMELALQFDRKVVIEAGVPNAREIECAVLGNDDPQTSLPGEIVPSGEFYDYNAKYLDGSSTEIIPATLTPAQVSDVQRLAVAAFRSVDGAGLSRVDFLLSRDDGSMFLNEVNTMPGFTTISMYPKMWQASGLAYPDLIDRLLTLALERHGEKQQLKTSIT
jgi:D-alanine-D-alanine ligase